ncbi:NAD-dependent epimerase/dehydratase family protein [Oleiharenicola lentus]|uniref:NAD-dependent epimerase/dehydratase family protein n=1 Tax=Oleiharenicola lentus TaxID=2508720 RepID=A0A4Q1CAG9_9BACT|nr:NAD-dependent epimerase/dehydratase family protein [Oleiharenicola lentus]RXK55862.1 NAD-dependent epimerase/dehydratase family protein [Oleiharenicola lentus]
MATFLVTGAAGFIASRVSELLLAEGHTVVGLDNLNDYYDVRLKEWRLARLRTQPGFVWQPGDIENLPALERVFTAHRFEAVINLAARAGVRASLAEPELYRRTNIEGARNVLECQRRFGVRKHVLASSSSLYAGCPMPFTEESPVEAPQSPYAETKKQAELLARDYHRQHGLDVTMLRYFTVFGPAGRPDMAPFRFIKWIDEGTPITLFGDGSQARDFTFVDDIARGTVLALKPLGCEVINLGGGRNPLSLLTVIGFIEKVLGKAAKIAGQPPSTADMKETWADIAKAKRLLNWSPTVPAEEGFRRTVEWHLANRDWVRGIRV